MAQMTSGFDFTGPLGNVSAYRMRGVEKVILRSKGGPTKSQIKSHKHFRVTRLNNSEFGGRSRASKLIRRMLWPLQSVSDYNLAGPLTALVKAIQTMDSINALGKRSILLSQNGQPLEGFNLNKKTSLDAIIRNPLSCSLSRETLTARVEIPALLPGINFFVPGNHPFYSITAVIGVVPDLFYSKNGYATSQKDYDNLYSYSVSSEWFATLEGSKANTLEVKYSAPIPDQAFGLMLSVGIQFGTMGSGGVIQQIPYTGAGKIMVMG